jgi:hypothetical protein
MPIKLFLGQQLHPGISHIYNIKFAAQHTMQCPPPDILLAGTWQMPIFESRVFALI